MNEKTREYIIEIINNSSPEIRDMAALAFALGHEDGWWLSRTDPDVMISPIDHAKKVNPFKPTYPGVQMILDYREPAIDDQQIPKVSD